MESMKNCWGARGWDRKWGIDLEVTINEEAIPLVATFVAHEAPILVEDFGKDKDMNNPLKTFQPKPFTAVRVIVCPRLWMNGSW